MGVKQLTLPGGRIVETPYPPPPPNPDTEFPSYPDSLTNMTLAWNRPPRHLWNLFMAEVFAEGLLNAPEYKWYDFTREELPAIAEAFLNHSKYLRSQYKAQQNQLPALTAVTKARTKAKNERR